MSNTTYSFSDVNVVISHSKVGEYHIDGKGIGTVSVTMATERTVQSLAADGSVMTSKVMGRNGIISFAVQQTSEVHKWLTHWFNFLEGADPGEWADTSITIRSAHMGDVIQAGQVAPQKLPDKPYQQTGQLITWNLMAADIDQKY